MGLEPLQLEERLLQPEVRRDRAEVASLLAEEFVEFGSSGRTFDREQILDLLENEPAARIAMLEGVQQMLAPGVALVTYRSVRPGAPVEPGRIALRSSLWVHRDGRWQVIFHQGTRVTEPEP